MNIIFHIPDWLLWAGGVLGLLVVGAIGGVIIINILFAWGFGGPWR